MLLIDDHPVVRRGVTTIVRTRRKNFEVEEAGTGRDGLRLARTRPFDVVVLDISLPDSSGFELLQTLRAERPEVPVLMLSIHEEEQYALRALRSGAAGYVHKACDPDVLLTAIETVADGSRFVTPKLAQKLVLHLQGDLPEEPHETLSEREFDVLRRIARGESLKEVAAALHLSPRTVSTYRARLCRKLGRRSNAQLALYASERGLVE